MSNILYEGELIQDGEVLRVVVIETSTPDQDSVTCEIRLAGRSHERTVQSIEVAITYEFLRSQTIDLNGLAVFLVQFRDSIPEVITFPAGRDFEYPQLSQDEKIHVVGELVEQFFKALPGQPLDPEIIRNSAKMPLEDVQIVLEFFERSGVLIGSELGSTFLVESPGWYQKLVQILDRQGNSRQGSERETSDITSEARKGVIVLIAQDPGSFQKHEEYDLARAVSELVHRVQDFVTPVLRPTPQVQFRVRFTKGRSLGMPHSLKGDLATIPMMPPVGTSWYDSLAPYGAILVLYAVTDYLLTTIGSDTSSLPMRGREFDRARFNEALQGGGLPHEASNAIHRLIDAGAVTDVFQTAFYALAQLCAHEMGQEDEDGHPEKDQMGEIDTFLEGDLVSEEDFISQFVDKLVLSYNDNGPGIPDEASEDMRTFMRRMRQDVRGGIISASHAHGAIAASILTDQLQEIAPSSYDELIAQFPDLSTRPQTEQESAEAKSDGIVDESEPKPQSVTVGTKVAAAVSEHEVPDDALDYELYANALGDLITHGKTETPLSICVAAPWGMGKTTLLKYMIRRIEKNSEAASSGETVTPSIWLEFNAWQYSKAEEIWATFYALVVQGIEDKLSRRKKFKLNWMLNRHARPRLFILRCVLMAIVAVSFLYLAYHVYQFATGQSDQASVGTRPTMISLGTFVVSLALLVWNLLKSLTSTILGKFKQSQLRLPPLAQDEILRSVEWICSWLERNIQKQRTVRKKKKQAYDSESDMPERIVVLIDDLDRCQPTQVMQILEAIKLILDSKHFVFVLAMDARLVRLAIGDHYQFMAESKGAKERLGHNYLEKIIQIPFHLPEIPYKDLINLKDRLFDGVTGDVTVRLEPPTLTNRGRAIFRGEKTDLGATDAGRQTMSAGGPIMASPDVSLDDNLDMKLSGDEYAGLEEIIRDAHGIANISPRLLKRIKNTYLLARHLYHKKNPMSEAPPEVFMKWMTLSIILPFTCRGLQHSMESSDWPDSWSEAVSMTLKSLGDNDSADEIQLRGTTASVDSLSSLLNRNFPVPAQVREFLSVANCFSFALD